MYLNYEYFIGTAQQFERKHAFNIINIMNIRMDVNYIMNKNENTNNASIVQNWFHNNATLFIL
jgi:hypothetical protein